jgi:uncharacterized membrane protein
MFFMDFLKSLSEKVAFQKQRSHRIEQLTDAVFAIVMTLLVLDIRIPLIEIKTESAVWFSLLDALPKLLTFILSFCLAGHFWTVFTNQFNYIRESDRNENVIAIFCLLPLCLLPFSASLLSEHLWSKLAVGLYISNILLILIMGTLHWLYSYRAGLIKVADNKELIIHKAIMTRAGIAITAYGVVACFCIFSNYLALCGIIFLQLVFTFSGCIETLHTVLRRRSATFVKVSENNSIHASGEIIL